MPLSRLELRLADALPRRGVPIVVTDEAGGGRAERGAERLASLGYGNLAILDGGVVCKIGKTDELGYFPVEDRVHVHDLHATILHLMGLDHLKLTYRFQGRDFRLTDVAGEVVEKLLA